MVMSSKLPFEHFISFLSNQQWCRECDFGPPDYSLCINPTLDPLTLVPQPSTDPLRQQTPQHCPSFFLVGWAVVDESSRQQPPLPKIFKVHGVAGVDQFRRQQPTSLSDGGTVVGQFSRQQTPLPFTLCYIIERGRDKLLFFKYVHLINIIQ